MISQFNSDHFRFFIEETKGVIYAISLILVLLNQRRYAMEVVGRIDVPDSLDL
jgi:hypothetical protein